MARARRRNRQRREFKDTIPGRYWQGMVDDNSRLADDDLAQFWYRRLYWNHTRHWEYSDPAYLEYERQKFQTFLIDEYDLDIMDYFDWEEYESWY